MVTGSINIASIITINSGIDPGNLSVFRKDLFPCRSNIAITIAGIINNATCCETCKYFKINPSSEFAPGWIESISDISFPKTREPANTNK
jgi:hypothetical protein